ncbi:hypothetical protein HPB47_002843 [Ixodes persulcatus]|uniref:Uncharacterized protein n=1 Tax=Ixodes persulcatus TaxID=34615 RepID=A0AC60PK20_IXOPE|nr:hypothetical protein HPB47_002843 [Ixodes persulcatus]
MSAPRGVWPRLFIRSPSLSGPPPQQPASVFRAVHPVRRETSHRTRAKHFPNAHPRVSSRDFSLPKCCTQALRWVILSDSRSALELLSRLERATPLARSIAQDAVELQQKGNDIVFQWLPSHCGIRGNGVVDFLAMRAHKDPECPLSTVPRFSDAKLLVRRAIALQHPDPVVVAGAFPARIPRGFDRQTAAVLHRLRTGSAFTPAWISHFRLNVDPICQTCEETADAQHLFLQCSDHEEERTNLRDAFSHLGLPSTNLEELLRPRASRATTAKALKSVVSFLRSTKLLEIL